MGIGLFKHFLWKGCYMSENERKLAGEVQPVMVITPEAQVLQMTNKELIAAFDPTEIDSLVAQRLKVKACCNPFMVWKSIFVNSSLIPSGIEAEAAVAKFAKALRPAFLSAWLIVGG